MKIKKILFIALFVIQLAIPGLMIVQKEIVLNQGEVVKFQIQPVDPYDAFRGKYLSIGVIEDTVYTNTENLKENQYVYALVSIDSDGFAYFNDISLSPVNDQLYIKCKIDYLQNEYLTLILPFDRYYINEEYSQMGEDLYNKYSNGNKEDAYITVRIKNGKAVLEDMYLSGIEIYEFIESELENE